MSERQEALAEFFDETWQERATSAREDICTRQEYLDGISRLYSVMVDYRRALYAEWAVLDELFTDDSRGWDQKGKLENRE